MHPREGGGPGEATAFAVVLPTDDVLRRVEAPERMLTQEERARAARMPRHHDLTLKDLADKAELEHGVFTGLTAEFEALVRTPHARRAGAQDAFVYDADDKAEAREVAAQLEQSLGPDLTVRDWTRTNRNWFAAVQVEKRLMFIILTLIVAVAAFNLVSTLVMTVTDKRADIAILRTLGATPRSVMGIFMVQGAASGVIGTLGGTLLGLVVAYNIDVIVPAIERALHISFLPSSVYLISRMPSDPQQGDIWPIALISLLLAFLATLYPSWSASRLQPAEALRYE